MGKKGTGFGLGTKGGRGPTNEHTSRHGLEQLFHTKVGKRLGGGLGLQEGRGRVVMQAGEKT